MADETISEKVERRVLVRVPVAVGTLLDLVCKYAGRQKRSMVSEIWEAGIQQVYGVSSKEVMASRIIIPDNLTVRRGIDLPKLVESLLRKK